MKKLTIGLLLAAGLLLIDVTPAEAHSGVERVRGYDQHVQLVRHHEMPRWLQRDRQFRHWYRSSPLRHYRQIGWKQLFDIYRWERRYFGSRYYVDYDNDRRWHDKRRRYRIDG
jgi:hypothetical protein